ncbi:MAG TPA: cation:proton antiporter, partial [Planctomycetota bacterium]|nr:cation:proton antiporter [Planctomycetota bacterium]
MSRRTDERIPSKATLLVALHRGPLGSLPAMPRRVLSFTGYFALLGGAVLAFWWLRGAGMGLIAPQPPAGATPFGTPSDVPAIHALYHVLLAVIVVLLASRGLGELFKKLDQPPVIGEMVAGIMIGPSLLGRISPEVSNYLLPTSIAPQLGIIAQIGVVLFMFLVGLELDTAGLRKRSSATAAIS